jgi:hypothetical protein
MPISSARKKCRRMPKQVLKDMLKGKMLIQK